MPSARRRSCAAARRLAGRAGPELLLLLALPAATYCQTVNDPALQVTTWASGLALPATMAFIGPDDALVTQKNNGQVRRVTSGVVAAAPVLDVAVHFSSERGLLGITRDPDFQNNRFIYLYYTESSTGADINLSSSTPLGNRVYRYTWNPAGGTSGTLENPLLLLDLPVTPGHNHNGGVILFGPDDALYVVIGDLNRDGRLQNFPSGPAPDDTGAILRVGADGQARPDNPFVGRGAGAETMGRVFAYGIRNSFGMTFDPSTGSLWESENGPASYDEVNRVPPGFNGGWEPIMGPDARDAQGLGDLWMAPGAFYRDPEFSWAVPVAPTALAFVASPLLGCTTRRDLLVGDNNCGRIHRFELNAARDGLAFSSAPLLDRVADNGGATCTGEQAEISFGAGFGAITDFDNGADGRLYVVSLTGGAIQRIGPRPGAFPDADGDGAPDACDCAPADAGAYAATVEIPRLRLAGGAATTLGWDAQRGAAGPGVRYTVVGGDVAALRRDGGFAAACTVAADLADDRLDDPRGAPPAGTAWYSLARAGNGCGAGTYGDGTGSPDPRDLLDAATLPPCPSSAPREGALVTLRIAGTETLTAWVTDDRFIDTALQFLAAGSTTQVPVFRTLRDGTDADPQWSWHPDPLDLQWADAAIEVCDGRPSDVEADKPYWFAIGFCPWSAQVIAVQDLR